MQEKHGGIKEHSMDKAWSKYGMNGVRVFLGLEDKYSKVRVRVRVRVGPFFTYFQCHLQHRLNVY